MILLKFGLVLAMALAVGECLAHVIHAATVRAVVRGLQGPLT